VVGVFITVGPLPPIDIKPTADSGLDDVFALKMSEAASDCAANRLGLSTHPTSVPNHGRRIVGWLHSQIVTIPARFAVVHHDHRSLQRHDGGVERLWMGEWSRELGERKVAREQQTIAAKVQSVNDSTIQ